MARRPARYPTPAMGRELETLREAARQAEARHDWATAFRLWDEVATESGDPFWDPFYAVRSAARAGLFGDALARHSRLVVTTTTESAHAIMRAEIEEQRGADSDAVAWWRRACEADRESYWARYGLARSLSRTNERAEARSVMAGALTHPSAEQGGAKFAASLDLQCGRIAEAHRTLTAFGIHPDERDRTLLTVMPGMTSFAERWCLRNIAATALTGAGTIVDLGSWLGSLSAAMASGIEANAAVGDREMWIHSFDQFIWRSLYMDACWSIDWTVARPTDGETFLPAFQTFTAPWSERIRVCAADLHDVRWSDGPIELLSVDAMKSSALCHTVMREFFPALSEGGYVFHQDFCHGVTWWIHLQHFLLHEYFAPVDLLEGSGGVLFAVTRPLSPSAVKHAIDANWADPGLAAEAFAFSSGLVALRDRGLIALAYARWAVNQGRQGQALDILEPWRSDPLVSGELQKFRRAYSGLHSVDPERR